MSTWETNTLRSCSMAFLNKRRNAISEILIMACYWSFVFSSPGKVSSLKQGKCWGSLGENRNPTYAGHNSSSKTHQRVSQTSRLAACSVSARACWIAARTFPTPALLFPACNSRSRHLNYFLLKESTLTSGGHTG